MKTESAGGATQLWVRAAERQKRTFTPGSEPDVALTPQGLTFPHECSMFVLMLSSDADPCPEAARHAAVLKRLTEIGMKLAEQLSVQADDPDADGAELALRFTRVARAVRQSVALEAQLLEQARDHLARAQAAYARNMPPWEKLGLTQAEYDSSKRAANRQFETEMIVGRAIKRDPRDRLHDNLRADFHERLLDAADEDLFASDATLAEIIAGICSDLGLSPDWEDWSGKDWGALDPRTRVALKDGPSGRPSRPPQNDQGWRDRSFERRPSAGPSG